MTPLQFLPTKKEAHRFLQLSTSRHMISSCWRSMISSHHFSLRWCCNRHYENLSARCRRPPSSRWHNRIHSHSLWTQPNMRGWTHFLHPPPLLRVQVNFICTSIAIRVHPQSLEDRKARCESFLSSEQVRCHSHLPSSLLHIQQSLLHTLNLHQRTLPRGLMRLPQRTNPATPHRRQSCLTGRTVVEFVAHDHELNHWYIHHQWCPHHTHNVHPYPHRGTGPLFHLSSRRPLTDPHQWTTTPAQTLHPGDAHEPRHTRYFPSALQPCRLHNCLPGIKRALLEAHSPHPLVVGETRLRRQKASHTDLKDRTSGSIISPTLSALIPSKVFMYHKRLIIPQLHPNTH